MQLRIPYSSADVGGLRYLRNGVVSDRDLDRTRFDENSSGSSTLGVPTLNLSEEVEIMPQLLGDHLLAFPVRSPTSAQSRSSPTHPIRQKNRLTA